MSVGASLLSISTMVAMSWTALADTTMLKCQGEWRSAAGEKFVSLEFSLQIDLSRSTLLDYTMFGTPTVPKPEAQLIGEMDDSSLMFMWPDSKPSFNHVIGIERVTGQFRHFLAPEDGDASDIVLLVRGKCEKTAAVF